jgi:hypothetical protein
MISKLINMCSTSDQADFSEQLMIKAKYQNVQKVQIEDCTVSAVTGANIPFTITPLKDGYFDNSGGQLWIVMADVPN